MHITDMHIEMLQHWPTQALARHRLQRQWQALLETAQWASIFQTFEWQEAWWQTFGAAHSLQLALVRDHNDALCGIAPLMSVCQRRFGLNERRLMLIGTSNHAADYADLIIARGHEAVRSRLLNWIDQQLGDWHTLEWRNLPADSPTLALLGADGRLPWPLREVSAQAPTRQLRDSDADRAVANKKSLRRHLNGFVRDGDVVLRRLQQTEEIATHLERFFDQHQARWADTTTPSLFVDPAQRAFYRALAERLQANGQLHFTVVLCAERAIAYHFGFERGGVFTWYKPSFDPALDKRSPGEVLIKLLLDHAIECGLSEFDFTVGSEAFKYRFANLIRQVYRVRVHRRAWQRWPAWARDILKRRLPGLRRLLRKSRNDVLVDAGTLPSRST